MQVNADWSQLYSADAMEADLQGFKFKGPGLYLTETDTLLIVPQPPDKAPTAESVWKLEQAEGTLYRVYVYNVPFSETIFAAIATAPVRQES